MIHKHQTTGRSAAHRAHSKRRGLSQRNLEGKTIHLIGKMLDTAETKVRRKTDKVSHKLTEFAKKKPFRVVGNSMIAGALLALLLRR